jgi:hypothetical protein
MVPGEDGGACVAHEADEEMYIVQRKQAKAEHLVGHVEVSKVRSRESPAGGALAGVVERAWIRAELGAFDVESAVACEGGAVSAHAGGRDAVEQVDSAEHAFDEIFGESDAHEVARAIAWELAVDDLEDVVHVGFCLADGEPPMP